MRNQMFVPHRCVRMIMLALSLGFLTAAQIAVAENDLGGIEIMPSPEPSQPAPEESPIPFPYPSQEIPVVMPSWSPMPITTGTEGGGELTPPPQPVYPPPMSTATGDIAGIGNDPFPIASEPPGTPVVGGGACFAPSRCGCRSNDPIYTSDYGSCIPPQGSCRNNGVAYSTVPYLVCRGTADGECALEPRSKEADCPALRSTILPESCANGGWVTIESATSCGWQDAPFSTRTCVATSSVFLERYVANCAPSLYPRGRAGVRLSRGTCSKDSQNRCVGQCRLTYLEPSAPEDPDPRCVGTNLPRPPATEVLPEATCSCGP